MITVSTIKSIINDRLTENDAYIVEISIKPGNNIYVEIDSFNGIPISYCIEISRLIEGSLDRDQEDFELQVASAGIGQPFKVIQQFHKYLNKEVEVLQADGKKAIGILTKVGDNGFEISVEEKVKTEGKKKKELQTRQLGYKFV